MSRIRILPALVALLAAWLLVSCAGKEPRPIEPVETAMGKAMRQYTRERYFDAAERFTKMGIDYAGSALMDSITYMQAESQFQLKEYLLAAELFEEVISRYPRSTLVDQCRYRIAESYYELSPVYGLDQSYTWRAIDEYQALLDDYPDSEWTTEASERINECRRKLAWKEFKSAELYYRMTQYEAALDYIDDAVETWYDQPEIIERALFLKGLCQARMHRDVDARATLKEYLEKYPDSERSPEAKELLDRLQNG